ncbi:phosphotransferase [Gordonia soli]|uniref:CHK kinase-like domain-containing protein n=1 Tax=Gordonia soli NBRC 108243 TaxID=1223545 RepID=M0QRT4_9ACTN|nr:phosphotransferase [Gordonia soli]GAC70357.1 hypothetical protein GS4_34_00430 [Gordonia soli NBRC 108243]
MKTPELPIPTDLNRISPQWMTEVLARDFPSAQVSDVAVTTRDDGTNRRVRLRLEYSSGSGPSSVFVKATDPDHKELLKLTSGIFHEPNLFNSGVSLPLEHPRVHAAIADEATYDFVVVMEDITQRGADPRDATRPLTADQVATGLRGLAKLHGEFWNHRSEKVPSLAWLEPFRAWDGMEIAPLPEALRRLGPSAPESVADLTITDLLERIWKPFIRTLTSSDQTLLHGDPHIGNTYVLPDGTVGFLDWQVARRGNWSLDVGYFLQGSLTIEDRREHEADLLSEYLSALELPAHELPATDDFWLRYRASPAHGLTLWLATLSAGDLWQRPDIALALAERYAAAFDDLDTESSLVALR